jgi:N6-L-threonylcarbamoyladenine synthase
LYSLGIESTAHTIGCSVIKVNSESLESDSRCKILSDVRAVYKPPTGSGIHPREASRHHCEKAPYLVKKSLNDSGIEAEDLDIIAYSAGPGLGPCLRVGAVLARTLAAFHHKPLVPVNHALGHIELGMMLTGSSDPLVLLVSGGHTMILGFNNKKWRVFGETLDITLGQLLDQFGRAMGFASPCGSVIEQLAKKSSMRYSHLPYIIKGNDVSLSGLLTAAIELGKEKYTTLADVCYSLQETSFAILTEAVERALSFSNKNEVLAVGGVAANKRLGQMLSGACTRLMSSLRICPIHYAGDNGAQIAWTGAIDHLSSGKRVEIEKAAIRQSWRLDTVEVTWR